MAHVKSVPSCRFRQASWAAPLPFVEEKTHPVPILPWLLFLQVAESAHQSVLLRSSTSPTSKGWTAKRKMTASYTERMLLPKTKTNASSALLTEYQTRPTSTWGPHK